MTDPFTTAYRTRAAGSLRAADAGVHTTVAGWVHRRRDLGAIVFVDLRDREGIVQVSFDPDWTPADVLAEARRLGPEDVVQVEGVVFPRVQGQHNAALATGDVEVRGARLTVLTRSEPLPIQVDYAADEELPAEDLRLRYRYLDLRRPALQNSLIIRHRAAQATRAYLSGQGFLEVETPLLTKPTPEGARDFLVPSRVHPGEFYALPQSPQIYKQLLMVSGYDRYFQIARCLRDEDLRADRQPEFTQIDAEMAFVDEEDVFRTGEQLMAAVFREILGVELPTPFPRMTYHEAMARYGSDKPDLRNPLFVVDVTEVLSGADFRIFQAAAESGQSIRGIRVPGGARLSRKELDELQEVAKRGGAAGALWVKRGDEGLSGQFAKGLDEARASDFYQAAELEAGDLFVAVVGWFRGESEASGPEVDGALDELRRHLGRKLNLVDTAAHAWLWVTEFPVFDWDAENDRLVYAHNPFSMPKGEAVQAILDATRDGMPSREAARKLYAMGLRSRAYDAVYNGNELASGSVRIHIPAVQQAVFSALGMSEEEVQGKFGFLLEAYRFGAPPHAGFAFGFDRLVMLLAGASSLRDVVAFPKTTSARALFENAPTAIGDDQLREVHVQVRPTAG
ncbi:aspartate--tRNA ligase [Longimicrobium terrae]|uniref:Aspartate--tRNA(Asp/Asn) ligase n=1 Tax=Longimicrobium terrae TaxID=1639882 RepID=A0A841H6E0_9BACT|nr:aspartate--tRNA ligase [Longimicrobium terrae]MBB4639170.1 aspartyl-tRNA synthetase [Longimicrobium terrae]MBB6073426.1 aspartyl-tRNA synthetase [Longimicrobium terrae]NNC32586.1 aspartate--tRNA ligase [Longimicrobium terrae]